MAEGFIDRLANFLKSLFGDDAGAARQAGETEGTRFRDPDLQDAWEELDEFMRGGSAQSDRTRQRSRSSRPEPPRDESLRQDYANLEVPFGADIDTVRRSYKRLMIKYHPDKYGKDPQQQKVALEITKKINESFERIRARQER